MKLVYIVSSYFFFQPTLGEGRWVHPKVVVLIIIVFYGHELLVSYLRSFSLTELTDPGAKGLLTRVDHFSHLIG
jgi:hypothetical protein